MNVSTVTTKGQATIPEEIRLLLQIQPGDKILYGNPDPLKKQATIKVVSAGNAVNRLYGSLRTTIPYMSMAAARKKAAKIYGKNPRH